MGTPRFYVMGVKFDIWQKAPLACREVSSQYRLAPIIVCLGIAAFSFGARIKTSASRSFRSSFTSLPIWMEWSSERWFRLPFVRSGSRFAALYFGFGEIQSPPILSEKSVGSFAPYSKTTLAAKLHISAFYRIAAFLTNFALGTEIAEAGISDKQLIAALTNKAALIWFPYPLAIVKDRSARLTAKSIFRLFYTCVTLFAFKAGPAVFLITDRDKFYMAPATGYGGARHGCSI